MGAAILHVVGHGCTGLDECLTRKIDLSKQEFMKLWPKKKLVSYISANFFLKEKMLISCALLLGKKT